MQTIEEALECCLKQLQVHISKEDGNTSLEVIRDSFVKLRREYKKSGSISINIRGLKKFYLKYCNIYDDELYKAMCCIELYSGLK